MNEKRISSIYKILLIYEDGVNEKVNTSMEDYSNYLNRLYVRTVGWDNEEISETIKGLLGLAEDISHKTLRSVVFHLIDILKKDGEQC